MAKPILIVSMNPSKVEPDDLKKIHSKLVKNLNDEYHVMFNFDENAIKNEFQCVNDCKGLPDVDIEKMINELLEK